MATEQIKARRYIIWAQPLTRSCGTKVLYTLYDMLREKGYDALIFCPEEHLDEYEYIDILDNETLTNDIVVYPEIVSGNPLRFQHVVRYVLYLPGALAGESSYYPSELVFTWTINYYNAPELHWTPIDQKLFFDAHLPKTHDCYFSYKSEHKDILEVEGAIEITMDFPATKEELAQLLKTTRVLYSFSRYSMLTDEAVLCGAKVLFVLEDGVLEEYKPYGVIPDSKVQGQLQHFIKMTQESSYSGPLQEEESFFHHYVGIFYMASARCAVLGAWEKALEFCRKAYLGKPLEKPGLQLPQDTRDNNEQSANASSCFASNPDEVSLSPIDEFLRLVAKGRYDDAERTLLSFILQKIREKNKPVISVCLVLLAHCYELAGRTNDTIAAETLALAANPLNHLATQLSVARALANDNYEQGLFFICRMIYPYLHPLNMAKVAPGMALLGMIAETHPDKLDSMAKRISDIMNSFADDRTHSAKNNDTGWQEALRASPLRKKITGF